MRRKNLALLIGIIFISLLILIPASAGFWDNWITGYDTKMFDVNITVAQITIPWVSTPAASAVAAGGMRDITINFTADVSPSTVDKIDCSSAIANFSTSGETLRENTSCVNTVNGTSDANFSCIISMWYWDAAADWNITAGASDIYSNFVYNNSVYFTWQEGTGFVLGPDPMTWSSIVATQTNQTATNTLLMNNTYNDDIDIDDINLTAINLIGETDNNYWIDAMNFTVHNATGGTPPVECGGSQMSNDTYITITGAILTAGNNTINAGDTTSGQEQLYFCLTEVNSTLTAQAYSSNVGGKWTLQIS